MDNLDDFISAKKLLEINDTDAPICMVNKMNERKALAEAYDNLIETFKGALEERITKYNLQMVNEALAKINEDLTINTPEYDFDIKGIEPESLNALDIEINLLELKINALIESRERMIK